MLTYYIELSRCTTTTVKLMLDVLSRLSVLTEQIWHRRNMKPKIDYRDTDVVVDLQNRIRANMKLLPVSTG
jgi:hypothetical protein